MTRSRIVHIEQLARRKAIYEALHPETKKGVVQAIGMHSSLGHNVSPTIGLTFVKDAEEKTGLSRSSICGDIQIATRIPEDVRELLRATPVAERSPRPTPTPSAPLRQGLRQRAKTARMALSRRGICYPTGNPGETAWRGSGKAWRGVRRRPEVDARLTTCTTEKSGAATWGEGFNRWGRRQGMRPSVAFAPPLARGRGNAHRGGFWRGGFCENMYTRCTRRFSRYANEATTA